MRLGLRITVFFLLGIGSLKSQEFNTIRIGKQEWMASNLNIKISGSWAYNEDPALEAKYGRLYTWEAAVKACPKGWRLPTLMDWEELTTFLGGEDKAGRALKLSGSSGFNAKLAGVTGVGNFRLLESFGAFWTSSAYDKENAWYIYLSTSNHAATSTYSVKTSGFSVRYIKNN
jgi:uncharacterized protein (TIGR02145 family)